MNQAKVTMRKRQLISTETGECIEQDTMSDLEASLLNSLYRRIGLVFRWQLAEPDYYTEAL